MNKINFFYPTLSGSVQPAPVIESALDKIEVIKIGLLINFTVDSAISNYTYEVKLGSHVAVPTHELNSMQVTVVDDKGTQNMTLQLSLTFEELINNSNFTFDVFLYKNDSQIDSAQSSIFFVKGGFNA